MSRFHIHRHAFRLRTWPLFASMLWEVKRHKQHLKVGAIFKHQCDESAVGEGNVINSVPAYRYGDGSPTRGCRSRKVRHSLLVAAFSLYPAASGNSQQERRFQPFSMTPNNVAMDIKPLVPSFCGE